LYGHLGSDAALCEFALCFEHNDIETVHSIAVGLVQSIKEPVQLGMEYHSIGANVVWCKRIAIR